MDLTNLIHTLTVDDVVTTIEEPQGFDNLKVTFERNEYHGISVESSVGTLGFYGQAANIVLNAYEADIDTEVKYTAKTPAGDIVYQGVVDLSTIQDKSGLYRLISCKVGDVGAKTTFNNRIDTQVDLNTTKTIDGAELSHVAAWKNILIPAKQLIHTNRLLQKTDEVVERGDDPDVKLDANMPYQFLSIFPTSTLNNEYGTIGGLVRIMSSTSSLIYTDDLDMAAWYEADEDFEKKYGDDTVHQIEIDLSVSLQFRGDIFPTGGVTQGSPTLNCRLVLVRNNSVAKVGNYISITNGDIIPHVLTLKGTISDVTTSDKIFVGLLMNHNYQKAGVDVITWSYANNETLFKVTIMRDSFFRTKMRDNLKPYNVSADMLMIHDALNTIVEAVSENALQVKSDYYAHGGSVVNPVKQGIGGGALKAITNGYKIRGLFTEGDVERNMPLSFKDAYESLNAIDCIGFGFEGESIIRVEPFVYFYKNALLFTLMGVNEITRSVDTKGIITKLTIGYEKYKTTEEYNATDSIHGERTFVSPVKALTYEISAKSKFIADNYSIEEARRAAFQIDKSESAEYDESIFVFELTEYRKQAEYSQYVDGEMKIESTVGQVSGVEIPTELINAKISPRQCAQRWKPRLFATTNNGDMKFNTGTNNYQAAFVGMSSLTPITIDGVSYYRLSHNGLYVSTAENADIQYEHSKVKAEIVSFEYPLTRAQYSAVKANPYGLIGYETPSGDIEYGWISKFEYSVQTGLTRLELIPCYDYDSLNVIESQPTNI